jgi:hypothetical protein
MVGQGHVLAILSPGKNLCIHFAGSWMGLGAGLHGCKNLVRPPPPLGFEPQTAQNSASHYADYAILAARVYVNILYCTGRSFHSGNVRRGADDIFSLATDDSACSVVVSPPLFHGKEKIPL